MSKELAQSRGFDIMYELILGDTNQYMECYRSPHNIDINPLINEDEVHCVYEIWTNETCPEYVGYSHIPYKRIRDHINNWVWSLKKCKIHIGIVTFQTYEEAISEETERIHVCDPIRNIIRPVY